MYPINYKPSNVHFNSSLSSISMNKRCLYASLVTSVLFYWLSMFKTKRWQPDLPTDMCKAICTLTKTVGLWEWTLLIWKTIQVWLGQFTWLSCIGWDIMSLRIVTKFQEDPVRIVWLRERTNLAAIHGCSHNVAFFKWAYNQRNITQHVDL